MSADYLISSLPSVSFDSQPPVTKEYFFSAVETQLSQSDASAVKSVFSGTYSSHPLAKKWFDLETQLRNAMATERAKRIEKDPSKWTKPAEGLSVFWTGKIAEAFNEKNPAQREKLLDQVFFAAAEELTPVTSPLSAAAAFTYAVRLKIAIKRASFNEAQGNEVFDKLTAAASPEAVLKE
jgi:hypothetical protein